jgi:ABC-type amino acid transport substrate-binding protein
MLRNRASVVLLATAALALVLSACGSPTNTPVPTSTTVPTAVATATAPAAPPALETAPATKPATLQACATSGVLRVGSDASYPPFESINEKTNKIEGFDMDLLDAIGQKAGFTVDAHNALFDTIFTALSYGQYDLVISASTITDERKQTVNFSDPYFKSGQVIVVRAADKDKVKTPDDLVGKTIGVQAGTTGAEAAKSIKNTKDVKAYPTAPEAFQALANGDVDAVINDVPVSLNIILNSPKLNLVVIGKPFTLEYYGIAVRKDCTDLQDKVNKALGEVIADGTYAKVYAKFFGEPPDPELQAGGTGIVVATPAPAETAAPTAAATPAATANP